MSCDICCENYDKFSRKCVSCPFCKEGYCKKCFRRYLMDTEIASCMVCRKELSISFIEENTPKCFYNIEYRNKQANKLLSLEKSLLPATQDLFKIAMKREISMKIVNDITEKCRKLRKRKREIKDLMCKLTVEKHTILEKINNEEDVGMNDIVTKKVYTIKCGVDDCRGYYNQEWVCGTCESKACSKCQVVLPENSNDDKHKCNKDDLKSLRFLKKDTKHCPKCYVRIHKINGCDQMFCMECKTSFSWNTGKIETGRIHNPHYYQWQREQNNGIAPRVPGDIPVCGELPCINVLQVILMEKKQQFIYLENCHRLSAHLRATVLRNLVEEPTENLYTNLRVKYLMKHLDEKGWHRELKKHSKKIENQREVRNVVEMFVNSLDDTMHAFSRNRVPNLSKACHALMEYVNKQLAVIDNRYNLKSIYIKLNWTVSGKKNLIR